MHPSIIAALFAAVALPVAAESATPRVVSDPAQVQVQAKQTKAKADVKVSARERAKLAKAQDKQSRKIAQQKHDKQKKAPAN